MALKLILAESPRARYITGAMMYFAQGIPQGLLSIAIPARLATQGMSASASASYLAVIVLQSCCLTAWCMVTARP